MKRLVGRLILFVLLIAVVCAPALRTPDKSADTEYEPTSISKYDANFAVSETGDLYVVETITVDFPSYPERHGIFRFWDTWDPGATYKRRIPKDVNITQDGRTASVEMSTQDHGRFHVARIGEPWRYMSEGPHVYVIRYRIDGVVEPGKDVRTDSQFYWNLIPPGWSQTINNATLRVSLPTTVDGVQCAVGVGTTAGCTVQGDGTKELTVRVDKVAARTPVTIKAGLEMATPDTGDTRPWPYRWGQVFGDSGGAMLVVLGLALLAGLFGWWRARTAFEPRPPYPLQYAPPEALGPAQGAYLFNESVPSTAFVATLLHMHETKLATLENAAGAWTLTRLDNEEGWAATDEITRQVASVLIPASGDVFSSAAKDVDSGQKLQTCITVAQNFTPNWGFRERLIESSGLGTGGGFLVVLAALAALGLGLINPFGMSAVALIPGLFAVGGLYLAVPGSGTRRTASGRDLWSRLGGFRRILATPSSEARFDFSSRKDLYTAYLPWAIVFGVADQWAAKYRVEVGMEPPVPSYFGSSYGYSTGMFVDHMVSNFESSINSSINAYQASIAPVSSGSSGSSFGGFSGGGGGFSGGGGGGGGGGGSW